MTNREETAFALLGEKNLQPQTLLENYLSVALSLRKCSLMTIPAEFPDAEAIAKAVDLACIHDYRRVSLETDARKKAKLIQEFKDKLREACQEKIKSSLSYRSHVTWVGGLSLQVLEAEVRPTIQELFFYNDMDTKRRLEELSTSRTLFRKKFLRDLREPLPRSTVAYPEEYSSDYVLGIGELLGYPKCCIEAYVQGRTRGNVLAEQRASRQIQTGRSQGVEPELYAYFVKDFIPCIPTCSNATAAGRKLYEGFSHFDNRLGEFYIQCLRANVSDVESYAERIEAHKERMKAQAQQLGIQTLR